MRKKSAIKLALEAAHSYDVGMTIPPDPITGSNKTIEINPEAAKRLADAAKHLAADAPHALHALNHKDPRMAHTEYLTEVGYHGKTAGGLATEGVYDTIVDKVATIITAPLFWVLKGVFYVIFGPEAKETISPLKRLAALEAECANLKSEQALALLAGKLELPAEPAKKLLMLAKEHPAWSMIYEPNQTNFALLKEALKLPMTTGWFGEDLPSYDDVGKLTKKLDGYLKVMEPHVPVMRKFKRTTIGKADFAKLCSEVTNNYVTTARAIKACFYSEDGDSYIGFDVQGNSYPYGHMYDGEGSAIGELMDKDEELYDKYVKRLEAIADASHEFGDKTWVRGSDPYHAAQFLLHGRIIVLETALAIEKGKIKMSTENFTAAKPKGPSFTPLMLSSEELAAHQLENVKRMREAEATQLAELTNTLVGEEPAIAKLVQLCSEGILKNLGGINEVLHSLGLAQYTPGPYELLFCDAKYPARISAALDERGELYNVLGTAVGFVDRIKGSAVLDLLSGSDYDALRAAVESIDSAAFSASAALLPNLETYSDTAIDEFFETIAGRKAMEAHQWEAAFVGARSQFSSLKSISYVAQTTLENFSPQLFFQYLNRFDQDTADRLRQLGQLANKAVRLLERGAFETMEVIESQARQNVRETIKLLERCQMIRKAPSAGMAMESFKADYATQSIGKIEHNEASQEALKSSFFWGSGKAKQTKVRESRKSSKERLNSGLQSELAEYLGKAIAKHSHVEDLRDLHYVGLVNEGAKYTRIANAVGIRGYDHNRWWSEYVKVQATFTEFSLDFFIQAGTQKSYVNTLLKEIMVFTQTFHSSDNVKTVVDAFNGVGSSHESPEEVARRVVRRFHDYNLVEKFESDHIGSAKDVVKVKNRYNVQLLEEVAGALDEFEGRVGHSLRDIYTIYQILCWHLHGADSVASYLMGSNRPLAMEFMVVRDTLVAIADVLVHALYTYNSLYSAHGNRLYSQILFVDKVLECDGSKMSTEGWFGLGEKKKSEPETGGKVAGNKASNEHAEEHSRQDCDDLAETFLEESNYQGGDFNCSDAFEFDYPIPGKMICRPLKNRKQITKWFEVNMPDALPKLGAIYTKLDSRELAPDTMVLPFVLNSKHHTLVQAWSKFARFVREMKVTSANPTAIASFMKAFRASKLVDMVKAMKSAPADLTQGYPYGDFLSDISEGIPKVTHEDYENAALGSGCTFSKIRTFSIHARWIEESMMEPEEWATYCVLAKSEDKYLQVEYEWSVVMGEFIYVMERIAKLSAGSDNH